MGLQSVNCVLLAAMCFAGAILECSAQVKTVKAAVSLDVPSSKTSNVGLVVERNKSIRIAVFVDAYFNDYIEMKFGGRNITKIVQDSIQSIFYTVARLFKDPALVTPIDIQIAKIHQMERNDVEIAQGFASWYLKNFCKWQQKIMKKSKVRWDHATLLTGIDLFDAVYKLKADVVEDSTHPPPNVQTGPIQGLANDGTMCNDDSSCSIVKVVSDLTSAAFYISHAIGSSLGIKSDGSDENSNCSMSDFIMASKSDLLRTGEWSSCSQEGMKRLNKKAPACVWNNRVAVDNLLKKKFLPGKELLTADDQCKFAVSMDSKFYSGLMYKKGYNLRSNLCRELWCIYPKDNLIYSFPRALDGTQCAANKGCYNEECLDYADIPVMS